MKKLLPLLLLTTLTPSCIFVVVDRVDADTAEKLEESATVYPVEHKAEYGPQLMDESTWRGASSVVPPNRNGRHEA